jgi:hypothetical protein
MLAACVSQLWICRRLKGVMFESFSNLCPAAEIGCGPEDPGWWTLRSVLADVPALVLIGHWLQGCCDSVDLLAMVASTERDDRRMLRWEKCLRSQMSCHPSHPSSFIRPAWYPIASHRIPRLYILYCQLRIEEELLMFGVCSSRSAQPLSLIAAN